MQKSIIIRSSCINCGKCLKVCPAKLFTRGDDRKVSIPDIQDCIDCGHCIAACPTESIDHSTFPPSKVHLIDYSSLPAPEQLLQLCRVRRSNRAFSSDPIPSAWLDLILEAAHRAPTASNLQQVSYTLITDPDKLRLISKTTINTFVDIAHKLENPFLKPILRNIMPEIYKQIPRFKRMQTEFETGNDLILRGAQAVILIHTPSDSRFGAEDANLAYQNGSLMAESLGVSQFYTGFVCAAAKQDKQEKLAEIFGIKGKIRAGMALGMPAFRFPNYIDHKPIDLKRF